MSVKGTGRTVATSNELMSALYTQTSSFVETTTDSMTRIRAVLNKLQSEEADNLRGGQGEDILENLHALERMYNKLQNEIDAIKFSISKKLEKTKEMLQRSGQLQDTAQQLNSSRNKTKK